MSLPEALDPPHLEPAKRPRLRIGERAARRPARRGLPSAYRPTAPSRSGRAQSRSFGRSAQPRWRMKIGCELPFGNVTVTGEPVSTAAASFASSSVEKIPWPR